MPANLPVRKHCRLKEYDYSQNGKYFITICSFKRKNIFSDIVGYLKMNVSKEIHKIQSDENIWQRSFYDHIIRNEQDFKKYWDYTLKNPYTWKSDKLYIDK